VHEVLSGYPYPYCGGTWRTRDWKGILKKEAYGSDIKISMPWRTGP